MALEHLLDRRTFLVAMVALVIKNDQKDCSPEEEEVNRTEPQSDNRWTFLSYQSPVYRNDREIRRLCPALGPRVYLNPLDPQYSAERENVLRGCSENMSRNQTEANGNPTYEQLTVEMFGTPIDAQIGQHFANYCHLAIDYLKQRIDGIPNIPVDTHIVQPGDNFRTNFNKKWFITGGNHRLCSIQINFPIITATGESEIRSCEGTAYNQNRGDTIGLTREGEYFVCLAAGEDSLRAPFSEGIPIITRYINAQYLETADPLQAAIVRETFEEMASQVLSTELARELNIPGGIGYINRAYHQITEESRDRHLYQHVPTALRWAQTHSLQSAFDLYMEDPGRFMEEIQMM